MIDTHAHLNYPPLVKDIPGILERAKEAGVTRMIIPGTDAGGSLDGINWARRYPNIYAAVGIHPSEVETRGEDDDARLREMAELDKVVAIGEVGLDYHYFEDKEEFEIDQLKHLQAALFGDMIELAKDVQKPLIIHSRDCFDDIYAQLSAAAADHPTVIHCFSGSLEEARKWLDMGYLLSFTGMITYKKNDELRDIVRQLPIEQIMVETNAPYLAPEGFRKEVCEPRFVRNVVECIAEVKGMAFEEVVEITTETAEDFFGLPS